MSRVVVRTVMTRACSSPMTDDSSPLSTVMSLPDQAIKEFQDIWREEFNEDISIAEARQRAEEFLRLIVLIMRRAGLGSTFHWDSAGSKSERPGPTRFDKNTSRFWRGVFVCTDRLYQISA